METKENIGLEEWWIRPVDSTKPQKTKFDDRTINLRHRNLFGRNMPFVNFDFIGMHYDNGIITDFTEFKHCAVKKIDLTQTNYTGMQDAADKLGVPFFIIVYDDSNWSYFMLQFNKNPDVKKWCNYPRVITEKNLVKGLYKVRGRACPNNIIENLSEGKFSEVKIPEIIGV